MSDSFDDQQIFPVPGDDPEMLEAASLARKTFRFFWREMAWEQRRIVPGVELATVKAAFSDPAEIQARNPGGMETEYMWVSDIEFDGRHVSGTLLNSPGSLQTFSEGDQVTFRPGRIYDWMYVSLGEVYGGFTVDLLRSRMSLPERQQHDDAYGIEFGAVGTLKIVPGNFTEGGKPATPLPTQTQRQLQIVGDLSLISQGEHPMSQNMRESLENTLSENPEYLNTADDNGFTFIHNLSLAGSYDGVDVCLNRGANPNQPAANGMTPMALAKVLGWKKIIARLQQAGATA